MGWFSRHFGGNKEEMIKMEDRMHMEPQKPVSGGKTTKDPVCGMLVDTSKPGATSTYQGQTYYFCSMACKKAFDTDPEKYLARSRVR